MNMWVAPRARIFHACRQKPGAKTLALGPRRHGNPVEIEPVCGAVDGAIASERLEASGAVGHQGGIARASGFLKADPIIFGCPAGLDLRENSGVVYQLPDGRDASERRWSGRPSILRRRLRL
jgi:hypothetical protein